MRFPWFAFGRRIRWLALAVMMATATLAWSLSSRLAVGDLLDAAPGRVMALAAMLAVGLLAVGWWVQSTKALNHGLLLAAAVWAGVSTVLWVDIGPQPSTRLACCWVVAAGGSWLIEADALRMADRE